MGTGIRIYDSGHFPILILYHHTFVLVFPCLFKFYRMVERQPCSGYRYIKPDSLPCVGSIQLVQQLHSRHGLKGLFRPFYDMLRVFIEWFRYIPIPVFGIWVIGNFPYVSTLLQLFLSAMYPVHEEVTLIIHHDVPLESSACFRLPLGIRFLQHILVPHHGITILHLMDFHPGRIILNHNLAYYLRLELICISCHRHSILVLCCCFRLPSICSPIRITLVMVICHIIRINFKCHRAALCITLRGLDLHQYICSSS